MAHLERSIIQMNTEINSLAHKLIIAIAKATKDPNYKAYLKGWKIHPAVQNLLETTCIDLTKGPGIPELESFDTHFREYKIVMYEGLDCDSIIFEGQVESSTRLNLLCGDVTRHYHVINCLKVLWLKESCV